MVFKLQTAAAATGNLKAPRGCGADPSESGGRAGRVAATRTPARPDRANRDTARGAVWSGGWRSIRVRVRGSDGLSANLKTSRDAAAEARGCARAVRSRAARRAAAPRLLGQLLDVWATVETVASLRWLLWQHSVHQSSS